jgi:hypothetical protein
MPKRRAVEEASGAASQHVSFALLPVYLPTAAAFSGKPAMVCAGERRMLLVG